MDIKGTNSQNSADSLEQLKQLKANFCSQKTNSADSDADVDNRAVDTASSEAFSSLKLKVSQAKQAGRAEYISQLKESVASGEYNISSSDLADALLTDGVGEFLVS
jgi:anti-sigma28 factor (negative regulator of flagellin synthesis)